MKQLFKIFNRKAQAEKLKLNDTRLYRFTNGDLDQLSNIQISEYIELLKSDTEKAIEYLISILEERK